MNIARVLYPVEVLGPGKRVGIWTCGCSQACPGCSNPELWTPRTEYEISLSQLTALLSLSFRDKEVDGFVITGGDPFYQADELDMLLDCLQEWTSDILVYTGFTYEELLAQKSMVVNRCLSKIGVLIDGRYIEEKNTNVPLRGSSNQKVLYLQSHLQEKYETYMAQQKNPIQNFPVRDGVISVGIHAPGFTKQLRSEAEKRGVMISDE